jgi:hypothetical protein
MAPKKKAAFVPQEKDDGTRWRVMRYTEKGVTEVYPARSGLMKREAQRLAEGLALGGAFIEQVEE